MRVEREDVGTTKRKPLTPTQRLKLFERENGRCCICGGKIFGDFIDEHKRALGLGGSNDPENRGVAHPKCAGVKTSEEDIPRIAKAKRQKMAAHGIVAPKQKIKSRGFPKREKAPAPDKRPLHEVGPSALARRFMNAE